MRPDASEGQDRGLPSALTSVGSVFCRGVTVFLASPGRSMPCGRSEPGLCSLGCALLAPCLNKRLASDRALGKP